MKKIASYRACTTLLGLALLTGLGNGGPRAADAPAGGTVTIKNFMFSPSSVTVKAGSSVTWTNRDQEPHTVVSDSGLFRSGAFDTDETFSFKFDQPGTYHFTCSIHPMMVGTVVVE